MVAHPVAFPFSKMWMSPADSSQRNPPRQLPRRPLLLVVRHLPGWDCCGFEIVLPGKGGEGILCAAWKTEPSAPADRRAGAGLARSCGTGVPRAPELSARTLCLQLSRRNSTRLRLTGGLHECSCVSKTLRYPNNCYN